jgi:hypothetical protein
MSRKWMAMGLVLAFGVAACGEDDPVDPGTQQDVLVGTWVSAGANVAPGLTVAPFNVDSIRAVFDANQTYRVFQYSGGAAQPLELTGTWQATTGGQGTIRGVTATQTSPVAVTAQGIFRVNADNTMQYEVIQTQPELAGVNAPTTAGGFGSTSIAGTATAAYVQTYVRR